MKRAQAEAEQVEEEEEEEEPEKYVSVQQRRLAKVKVGRVLSRSCCCVLTASRRCERAGKR